MRFGLAREPSACMHNPIAVHDSSPKTNDLERCLCVSSFVCINPIQTTMSIASTIVMSFFVFVVFKLIAEYLMNRNT